MHWEFQAMLIIAVLVYLFSGWLISNALVKRGILEDALSYICVLLLWLPIFVLTGLWRTLKWLFVLPKRFADSQIEKHSK